MRRLAVALALAGLAASPAAAATETWVVDRAHSEVSFQIRHMMAKVRGSFNDFTGTIVADAAKPEAAQVEFTIKSASIDTGIENRDKHLRSGDFFDVEKFPEISFKSTKVVTRGKDKYDVTGNLTMHGVTKEVTLPLAFLGVMKDPRGNEKAGFESSTTLNRKDFGIVYNTALDAGGFVLGDETKVDINLQFAKKKPEAAAPATK
jgi:polyisoprenoid-binding protein YceI